MVNYSKSGRETAQTFPAKKSSGGGASSFTVPTAFPLRLKSWTQNDPSGDADRDVKESGTSRKSEPKDSNPRLSGKAAPAGVDAVTGKGSTEEHLLCRFDVDTVVPGEASTRMSNQYHKRGISRSTGHSHTCSC